ncbi:hypothetical protein [Pseudanabaena sp. 'Roaring Creek']|uniref:hypothetical protein n=1 Tax=Pseudanabaena sp. 'Roaring Creek' TaxID=1681830 RepID=UPI000AE28913|nr:hypothetical protein [Pseudanabaena sp. 'Roaring Creek']
MAIFKGFTIGLVCLVLGGVIGFKARYFELQKEGDAMMVGIEVGKKQSIPKN